MSAALHTSMFGGAGGEARTDQTDDAEGVCTIVFSSVPLVFSRELDIANAAIFYGPLLLGVLSVGFLVGRFSRRPRRIVANLAAPEAFASEENPFPPESSHAS